jgi:cereblon
VSAVQLLRERDATSSGSPAPDSERSASVHEERWLCCARCALRIVPCSAIFRASFETPLVFANPDGMVFELVTASRAEGLVFVGPAVSDFSWFPGYAWRVALCAGCSSHLGWRYEACAGGVTPLVFFGLQRAALLEQG